MPQNETRASISNNAPISAIPADILLYRTDSLLDTVFVNKSTKKPAWITITSGSQTTLYSVSTSGKLTSAAMIEWQSKGKGSKKSDVTVKIGEETFPGDGFGRPPGGFYGSSSIRRFTVDNLNCQWACHSPQITDADDGSTTIWRDHMLEWNCTAEIPGSSPSPPLHTSPTSKLFTFFKTSSTGKQRMLLARYLEAFSKKPSQALMIYPDGVPYTVQLMISAIFSDSGGGLWKKQQSKASTAEVEATLSADFGGELPTYTPVRHTSSTRTELHPSVSIRRPSRWAEQRPRPHFPTPPDDLPPEYAPTQRPSTQ